MHSERLILFLVAVGLLACRGPHRPASTGFAPELLTYRVARTAAEEPVELQLHVFKPTGWQPEDRRPAIVFFFGGGWRKGSPHQFHAHCEELASRGMVAASAEYRVASRHGTKVAACVEDGKSAVRFLRHHAADLGIDPNRIVAAGGSAGGHVAACTGLVDGFEPEGGREPVSSVPQLLILFNPVLDTSVAKRAGKGDALKRFGVDPLDVSPQHHVHAEQPPALVLHGTADRTVPIESARQFVRSSEAAGARCALVEFEGAGHGFFNTSDLAGSGGGPARGAMDEALRFLEDAGYLAPLDGAGGTGR